MSEWFALQGRARKLQEDVKKLAQQYELSENGLLDETAANKDCGVGLSVWKVKLELQKAGYRDARNKICALLEEIGQLQAPDDSACDADDKSLGLSGRDAQTMNSIPEHADLELTRLNLMQLLAYVEGEISLREELIQEIAAGYDAAEALSDTEMVRRAEQFRERARLYAAEETV